MKRSTLRGTLLFNMRGGGARLVGEDGKLFAWLREGATATALHGDTVECRGTEREALVVKVITRARETFVGTWQRQKSYSYVIPDDPRFPANITVRAGGPELPRSPRSGDKVLVKLEPWTNAANPPAGQIIELLGTTGDPGVDMLSIIRQHNLQTDFPAACEREAAAFGKEVKPGDIGSRKDCRGDLVLTIDPDDAKDHDDAIFVEKTRSGWRLAVHIADVAHYVFPGSALDREARRRGNSTYLADRCIPMLPFALSAGLCSLHEGVDRLANSVFFEINAQGRVKSRSFARTVIHVRGSLTYKQAQTMLRGGSVRGFPAEVGAQVRLAGELAALFRKHRFEAGSLDLDFPEVKVRLDENGRATSIERIVHDESHQLIEEFMLAANEAVAAELKNRPTPAIYRIHEKPDPDRLDEYRQAAAIAGVKIGDLKQRKEVQKLLGLIKGRPDELRLKIEFLKSLRRAEYSPDPLGHYGLAKADYLHFTSPIRRYADLVAHRALARERVGGRKELAEIAEHISDTERVSADAERDSVLVKKMEYFQQQLDARKPDEFDAIVTDVKSHGLLIELPAVDTTGFIPVELVPGGPFVFDSPRVRLVNRRSNRIFKPGDRLKVHVARVDAARRQIEFSAL